MSYENPNSPKYIPTAARSKEVGDAMLGVVKSQEEAKQLEKDRLKADRTNELAWGDALGEDFNGQLGEGVLNAAYAGSGREYAALQRMVTDQPERCQSDNCRVEMQQLQILKDAPKQSIAMLGTFESAFPTLDEKNVDKTQPLYTKMKAARAMIKGLNGYGPNQGYSIEVVRNKKDGKYTGTQELVLKAPCKKDTVDGCPFGESGEWKINDKTLENYDKGNGSLLTSTPDWSKQALEIDESSGVFDFESGTQAIDTSFIKSAGFEDNGKPKLRTRTETGYYKNDAGDNISYEYQVYDYDMDKIKAKVGGYIAAEVDAMFDPSAGGPNDAIAMWNQTLAPTAKDTKEYKDFPFINKDGTMDWRAADTSINKPGTPGSVYAQNGELKPEVKELYKQVYTDHYMKNNVQEFINKNNETAIPGTLSQLTGIETAEVQIANYNARKLLGTENDPDLIVNKE